MSKQAPADQHSRFALLLLIISMVSLSNHADGTAPGAAFLRGFVDGMSVVGLGALIYALVRATRQGPERL
jgi:hypothetical protein